MRIWLVDDRAGDDPEGLESLLRQLEKRPAAGVQLVGASPFHGDFVSAMGKLVPELLDVIVLNDRACPTCCWTEDLFRLGTGFVIAVSPPRWQWFGPLAETFPLSFVPPRPGADALWLALAGAWSASRALAHWRRQAEQLQQRLQDRIVVERAKGVLMQRLGICEDEAYKRLRLQSRRQRRQLRDIAQSFLDTQVLLLPGDDGDLDYADGFTSTADDAAGREAEAV